MGKFSCQIASHVMLESIYLTCQVNCSNMLIDSLIM